MDKNSINPLSTFSFWTLLPNVARIEQSARLLHIILHFAYCFLYGSREMKTLSCILRS
jgi:hypothetical protein